MQTYIKRVVYGLAIYYMSLGTNCALGEGLAACDPGLHGK